MKQRYRIACQNEPSIPLFSQAWWLDAVAGEDGWGVALVEKNGQVVASLPYIDGRRFGFSWSTHPLLTQSLGPWLKPSSAKNAKRLSQQQELMAGLIEQLPGFSHFAQNWHYSQTNWLPFYWNGFRETTRYTYVLPDLSNEELLWQGLRQNIRTDIRKATNRFELQVRDDLGIDEFLTLNRMVFERQGKRVPYDESLVRRLDRACDERQVRRIFIAEDAQGQQHAGAYLVWDKNSAYYLMGGSDPDLRASGATSLCLWHAIRFAATVTKRFDFEGSMIESVERFVRAFGASQTPYFHISRTTSFVLKVAFFLRSLT